ncbi:hypothetical protein [Cellulomonas sp.]|uniref:hypothetical protein n=1 Tax=Cellulomonas sp. TaxID=40001 RepID=UPI003BA8B40F
MRLSPVCAWPRRQRCAEAVDESAEPFGRQPALEEVEREHPCRGAVLVDALDDRADDEHGILGGQLAQQLLPFDVGVPGRTEHAPEVSELAAQRVGDGPVEHGPIDPTARS